MSTITKPTFDPHPMFSEANLPQASGGTDEVAGGGSPSAPDPQDPIPNTALSPILLDDILDHHLTPSRVCQLHNLTLAQLRAITQSDEFKQAIEDTAAINESRRDSIRDHLHTQALAAASDLINEAAELTEQNRICTTDPRPQHATNPEAHRRALSAATRQHATNARLLETRRKTINTILKECKPKHPAATTDPRRSNPCPTTPDHQKPNDKDASPVSLPAPSGEGAPPKAGRRGLPHSPQPPSPSTTNNLPMQSPTPSTRTILNAKEHPAQTGRVWRENKSTVRIAASKMRSRRDENLELSDADEPHRAHQDRAAPKHQVPGHCC